MPIFLYCGHVIASDLPLPELPHGNLKEVGFSFSLKPPKKQSTEILWLNHWLSPSGEKLLSYGKQDSCHWLHFPGLANFCISANVKEISCYPLPEIPLETIRHLLLDQVLPRCLAYQGKIIIHGSAVCYEKGLILFVGDSGVGKSTLAGDFHQAGYPALSDDCLWIKEGKVSINALPSYGGLRLWEDSLNVLFSGEQNVQSMAHYSTKTRLLLNENETLKYNRKIPILAVIILPSPDGEITTGITLDRLSNRERFIALMKQSFHLDVLDFKRMTRHIRAIGRIAPRLPTYRLTMPHDYALLPLVRQKILEKILAP